MAVIRIQAQKDARCMQAVCQIHGDRRTQILRFDVNRFDGGVDLGGLRWVIKTTNALGKEDIFDPEAVEIKERTISVDWLVDGSVTDATGIAGYELNGIDTAKDGQPVQWSGGLGSISVRAGKGPKFGETDGMTNIEKLILYVEGELQSVIEAGDAAAAAAERANRAADNIEDVAGTIARADAAAQRATQAAEAVEDLEGAVNRANAAAASVNNAVMNAEMAASNAYSEANRAKEAADAVENITEAVTAAHEAAETANNAAATANAAALPHVVLYGTRVHGETAKASGNPVTFLPDAGSLLRPVTVLEPKQAGSGDPSPSNIRPFTGYDKLDLNAAGKNLLPDLRTSFSATGITFTKNADGSWHISGTATATTSIALLLNTDKVSYAGGMYTVSLGTALPSGVSCRVEAYDKTTLKWFKTYGNIPVASGMYTINILGDYYTTMLVAINSGTAVDFTIYPMIRLASIADATYAPSHYKLHTVQIGQTVYGLRYEWLTGMGVIEWKAMRLLSSYVSTGMKYVPGYVGAWMNGVLNNDLSEGQETILCSHLLGRYVYDRSRDGVYVQGGNTIGIQFSGASIPGYTDTGNADQNADLVKAYLDANEVWIAWKLATPIEIGPLTPHIISTADPEQNNTLYGDGNIEVEYVKPLHVSIEERVAAAVAAAMNAEGV